MKIKKVNLFIFFFLFFNLTILTAEDLILAPLVTLNSENQKMEMEKNPNLQIFEQLQNYWFDGLITIKSVNQEKYGAVYSVIDAERVCSLSNANYIIYGYIQQNENSWYGNLKLYDFTQKKVIKEFFASDDLSRYERFITTINTNIVSGLEEILGRESSFSKFENGSPFLLYVPASLYYWNVLGNSWESVLFGIAGGNIGIDVYPGLENNVFHFLMLNFSIRPQISYSYAMNTSNSYPLNYNSVGVGLPVIFHIHFYKEHAFYLGCGPYYEIELLQIQQKYSETQFYYQSMFGLLTLFGYSYDINESIKFFAECEFDFHFSNDNFYAIKPIIGASFNVFKEKKNEK